MTEANNSYTYIIKGREKVEKKEIKRSEITLKKAGEVEKLREKGLKYREIAEEKGIGMASVARYLSMSGERKKSISDYISHRASLLGEMGLKASERLVFLLTSLSDEEISSLSPSQKGNLAVSLAKVRSFSYNDERLERGKSTENFSVQHLDKSLKELMKTKEELLN